VADWILEIVEPRGGILRRPGARQRGALTAPLGQCTSTRCAVFASANPKCGYERPRQGVLNPMG